MRALLVLLLLPAVALAADVSLTCQPPTQFEGGTAIPAGTTITFTLYGADAGKPLAKLASGTTCSFQRANVSVGDHQYQVTATVNGAESDRAPSVPLLVNVSRAGIVTTRKYIPAPPASLATK